MISTAVSRASQTHQVPHIGWPQTAPVISATAVKAAPTGAAALATRKLTWWRRTRPMPLATAITK
jgi:hypothetical protein